MLCPIQPGPSGTAERDEMPVDEDGQDSTTTETETPLFGQTENSQTTDTEQTTETSSEGGYNPVWEPLRQELGLQFEAIKPHLAKVDKDFNEHVTKTNEKYNAWKQFDEAGVKPENVTAAFTALQNLEANPEEAYEALGKFLEENGRLPQTKKELDKALDDVQEDDDEFASPEAKKIRELEKQLKDFQTLSTGQTEAAQRAADEARQEILNTRAEQEVAQEYRSFQNAHPDLSKEDWQEIQKRHYLYALQGPEAMKSLDEVGKEFFELSQRIRSAPRPNDLAPRLPGAGGAVPAGERKDPSTYSREESVDALTNALLRARENQN